MAAAAKIGRYMRLILVVIRTVEEVSIGTEA